VAQHIAQRRLRQRRHLVQLLGTCSARGAVLGFQGFQVFKVWVTGAFGFQGSMHFTASKCVQGVG
jgi:hypothetical protein